MDFSTQSGRGLHEGEIRGEMMHWERNRLAGKSQPETKIPPAYHRLSAAVQQTSSSTISFASSLSCRWYTHLSSSSYSGRRRQMPNLSLFSSPPFTCYSLLLMGHLSIGIATSASVSTRDVLHTTATSPSTCSWGKHFFLNFLFVCQKEDVIIRVKWKLQLTRGSEWGGEYQMKRCRKVCRRLRVCLVSFLSS